MGGEHRYRRFRQLAGAGTALALVVVILGAWVRLTGAGLGCPDWPGCYGKLAVPAEVAEIAQANAAYPERPLESGKAWREMIHRYFAGTLGLIVLAMAALAWRNRSEPRQPVAVPFALLGLVTFQALLGMWTVTLLLKPLVVVAHLLGGMTTLALLAWLALPSRPASQAAAPGALRSSRGLRRAALIGLALVAVQIALGGWTSSNYAALACPDFPTCQHKWWPEADFGEGFVLWRGLGVDYEGGVLDHPARVAIHLTHRLGAAAVLLILGSLAAAGILRSGSGRRSVRLAAAATGITLLAQVAIGIAIVVRGLPLGLAVAHNATAALLLLAVVAFNHSLRAH